MPTPEQWRQAEQIVKKWESNAEWNRRADARQTEGVGRWLARIVEQRRGLIETIAKFLADKEL